MVVEQIAYPMVKERRQTQNIRDGINGQSTKGASWTSYTVHIVPVNEISNDKRRTL